MGDILSSAITDMLQPAKIGQLGFRHAGCWECDLADDSLIWSGGVYDIFGLARGASVKREEVVSFYREDSRAKMESLRAYSIRHKRGFTVDVELKSAVGENRWMRLIAAPICDKNEVTRLHGLKLII